MQTLNSIKIEKTRLSRVLDGIGNRQKRRVERMIKRSPFLANEVVRMDLITKLEYAILYECKKRFSDLEHKELVLLTGDNTTDGIKRRNALTHKLARLLKTRPSIIRTLELSSTELESRIARISTCSQMKTQLALTL